MQTRKVYLYVFHTMSDWEYGYLIAELNSGRYFKQDAASLKVVTVGVNKEMITTLGGLSIKPDISLDECTLGSQGETLYEKEPAVSDKNLVTASGIAPLEFAVEVLKKLDVFAPDTLRSWYKLNKTQKPEYFFELMNTINR